MIVATLHATVVLASTTEQRTALAAERPRIQLFVDRPKMSRVLSDINKREKTAALADRTTKDLKR